MTLKTRHFCLLISAYFLVCVKCREYGENKFEFVNSCAKASFEKFQVLKVRVNEQSLKWKIFKDLQREVDFWTKPHRNETDLDFLVSPSASTKVRKYLKHNGIPFSVMFDNVGSAIHSQSSLIESRSGCDNNFGPWRTPQNRIRIFFETLANVATGNSLRRSDSRWTTTARKALQYGDYELLLLDQNYYNPKMSWTEYHSLETIYEFLNDLEREFPNLIKIVEIGKTYEGKRMLMAKIGRNIQRDFSHKHRPAVFIEGGIHAREWISPATATFIINELVRNSAVNADVLDKYNFFILPVANPDGYAYSQRANRMWRKNRSPNYGFGALINPCWGVDLNRNFGYQWGANNFFNSVSGTRLPCLETYTGPKPFSEPETKAIRDFVLKHKEDIHVYFSLHSYGEKLMYPWGYTSDPLPDYQQLHDVGVEMAQTIYQVSGHDYWVGSASDTMYVTSGSSDDWFRGIAGIKWVYLFELPDKNYGFLLPPSEISRVANGIMGGIRTGLLKIASTFVYFYK